MYRGFVALEGSLPLDVLTHGNTQQVSDADSFPLYRIYGPAGLMPNGTGTLAFKDSGIITGATNASPIVVTSDNHGLTTGTSITISGVAGNTNANGVFTITVVDSNSFSLNGTTGNAPYTSGGSWHVTGLYTASLDVQAENGFTSGQTYSILVLSTVSSVIYGELDTFTVV